MWDAFLSCHFSYLNLNVNNSGGRKDGKHCYIQVAYYLTKEIGPDEKKSAFDREYDAFDSIKDGSPRYVMSLDKIDTSHNGITHLNIEDFLLNKIDIKLS